MTSLRITHEAAAVDEFGAALDLSGVWRLAMADTPPAAYPHRVELPGSLQAQGFGEPPGIDTAWTGQIVDRSWFTEERYAPYRQPGAIKIPFWLQIERHYTGMAWFAREVAIPESWRGRRIVLFLERPHISTTVRVDGRTLGSRNSLGAPHEHDLGCALAPGLHMLEIGVDNRLHVNVGPNAHSVSDNTQSNWNGIAGRIELRATSPVWLDDVQFFPDSKRPAGRLRIRIGNATGRPGRGVLRSGGRAHPVSWNADGARIEVEHAFPDNALRWDECCPALHTIDVALSGDDADDRRSLRVGLRTVRVEGRHILLNGRRLFLRGTLECAVFPQTGYPPTDKESWQRIFSKLRDYGFNHVRFHSWCPPDAAFDAADEQGFYLQIECGSWANTTTGLGVDPALDAWLYEEGRAIVRAYGHHPSFLFMACGNEPAGEMHRYLAEWLRYWKAEEPRRLHTGAAGWPKLDENEYDNLPQPRLHRWGEGLDSRLNAMPPSTVHDFRLHVLQSDRPLVAHETGQWCAYPDFRDIDALRGPLRARNYEIFRASLEANHMGDLADAFVQASGKLQALCYREEIETALRTREMAGYQLLQANDFPGQGTAPVGWFNTCWKEKGYTTGAAFRRFQNATVLLARLERRVFSVEDTLFAQIEIAHFGPAPLANAAAEWTLCDNAGTVIASGQLPARDVPIGNGIALGAVVCALDRVAAPAKCRLAVRLAGAEIENDWELWVYPIADRRHDSGEVLVTASLDEALERAEGGGKILLLPRRGPDDVKLGFTPIFWNTAWTRAQAPHTLGILCDPAHPLFRHFPTEFHTNWQWWEVLDRAKAVILDPLPPAVEPIVRVIDDWFTNQRLGLVFEVAVGRAKLLVCGADLMRLPACRHAARQFRASVLAFMQSDAFSPTVAVEPDDLRRALNARSPYADVKPR